MIADGVKERPIIFSAPMVKAILEGRKTQTRRVAMLYPSIMGKKFSVTSPQEAIIELSDGEFRSGICNYESTGGLSGPYKIGYAVGDLLWVRECFSYTHDDAQGFDDSGRVWYWADGNPETGDWTKPKPSIYLPRWASRITLELTDVRAQRLREISEEDAIAEGCVAGSSVTHRGTIGPFDAELTQDASTAREAFCALWNSINLKRAPWLSNPLIFALTFRRAE
jgi:hypothetical protein